MKNISKKIITGAMAVALMIPAAGMASAEGTTTKYTVQGNDTLSQIAQQYGIDLNKLIMSNPQLFNPNLICPGFQINIPGFPPTGQDTKPGQGSDQGQDSKPDQGSNQGQDSKPGQGSNQGQDSKPGQGSNQGQDSKPGQGSNQGQGTTPGQGSNQGQGNVTQSQFAAEVVNLVNQERAKAGLQPLKTDFALAGMAMDKAKDMYNNNYFDHTSPTYGSPFDMMNQYGITYRSAGENIAKGQRSPEEVMNAWMNSPGHRQNILNSSFNLIGVAYYNGEWVQEFVGR